MWLSAQSIFARAPDRSSITMSKIDPTFDRVIRLRTHNQKMTVAAIQIALMKVCAHRSYRVAMMSHVAPLVRATMANASP